MAEQAARTTPYVPTRIGPRNIAPSRVVIKTTGRPSIQRRDRSHLDPRWDSHFVDMSDGDEGPAGHTDGAPPDIPQGTNQGNDNNDNNNVAPQQDAQQQQQPTQRTLSRREIAEAMQRAGHTHALHPQLVNRINAILARTLFIPPQGDSQREEGMEDSLVKATEAINRWLHVNMPTNPWDLPSPTTQPSTSTGRTGSPPANQASKSKGRTKSPTRKQTNNAQGKQGRTHSPSFNNSSQPTQKRPQQLSADLAESYATHRSSVILFNSVFPLGRQFNRWKDGIRVFLKTKTSRQARSFNTSPCLDATIKAMLEASIIKETTAGPFESKIFLVEKSNGKMRPVIDLHHLVRHSRIPRFYLPSIFQVIRQKPWKSNLFFIKFDFKNAFFNINLHPKSMHIFNFFYDGKFFL